MREYIKIVNILIFKNIRCTQYNYIRFTLGANLFIGIVGVQIRRKLKKPILLIQVLKRFIML